VGIDQPSVGSVEQRGGQAAGADFGAHFGAGIKQDIVDRQPGGGEIAPDRGRIFALIGKHEVHPGFLLLRGGEQRHLAPAGRAPGGPQIDDHGLARSQSDQICRLARKGRQCRLGQGRIAHAG
jgi:hypothetical protein